jgi:hypothetical protein
MIPEEHATYSSVAIVIPIKAVWTTSPTVAAVAQEHPCRYVLAGVSADFPPERIVWARGGDIGRASASGGTAGARGGDALSETNYRL